MTCSAAGKDERRSAWIVLGSLTMYAFCEFEMQRSN